jgi:UrcA family protein
MTLPVVLLGSLLGGGGIGSAQAATRSAQMPAVPVHYTKAELLNDAGIVRVHERLKAAARSVCYEFESRELGRQAQFTQCVASSLSRAVAQIHDPALTAYHEHRTGYLRQIAAVNGTEATAP